MPDSPVDALVFDVFGTVVDWRSGVIRGGTRLGESNNLDIDWPAFAEAWREEYRPSLDQVRRGEIAWRNLDTLHRESLEELLDRFDIQGLTETETIHLNRVWHRLDPWPDAIPGLTRLKKQHVIAPLSNGHVRLLTEVARRKPTALAVGGSRQNQHKNTGQPTDIQAFNNLRLLVKTNGGSE
jgi:Predicted hydrolase (HAD superfamily)